MEPIAHPFFNFGEQQHLVRIFGTPFDPWFAAADVCIVLSIANSRDAMASLDEEEKITVGITDSNPREGVPHQLTIINESGLYTLIFRSRKPQAKAFRKWVTGEVLPALRRTGTYTVPGAPAGDAAGLHQLGTQILTTLQGMAGTLQGIAEELQGNQGKGVCLTYTSPAPSPRKKQLTSALPTSHPDPLPPDLASLTLLLAAHIIAHKPPGAGPGRRLPLAWIRDQAEAAGLLPAHYATLPVASQYAAFAKLLHRGWHHLTLKGHHFTKAHGLRKSTWLLTGPT